VAARVSGFFRKEKRYLYFLKREAASEREPPFSLEKMQDRRKKAHKIHFFPAFWRFLYILRKCKERSGEKKFLPYKDGKKESLTQCSDM